MRGKPRTFQTRARIIKDDGDDFEDFVFECFRIAKEERGFFKRLARGRDGAIDMMDRFGESGAITVAECKYVGSGKAEDATGRWREVYANLHKYLPKLQADQDKNVNSPYRAWLDPARPITHYRFCVTAAMTDAEIKALEARIVGDFAKLAEAGASRLDALQQPGAVRVLPWDWFHAELEEHPSLRFRWFRGLPAGVELFAEQDGAEVTFRDFLKSGQLRFFSRDEYAGGGIGQVDRGEAELIAQLAGKDGAALLITGPGGVGKTRLSWELADELSKPEHGFDGYRLGRSAGYHSVVQLAELYPGPASILLLVDYAEAAPKLSEIADAMEHVASNSGHRVRLIATCRASAVNQVKDAVSVLPFEEKSLGSVRTGEGDYVRWVTRSILALEPIPESAGIERVCHGVPALAAFAIFLFRRHHRQFDVQFGALHGLDDFETWANHRIAALIGRFGGDPSIGRVLSRIALALPLAAEAFEAIEAESALNRSLLRALMDDCWIEREDDCYFAAHDVLADALIARWVLEADHAATERAIDLLRDAARQGRLAGALIALDRLALHPKSSEIDGSAVAGQLLRHHPEQVLQCCGILLGGSLLDFEEKLDLLHGSEEFREALELPTYDVGLSFLAAQAVRRRLSVAEVPALATLTDLLDRASEHAQSSNMVLRRAYALDPQRFRARALASIGEFPQAEPTHFLLAQMLRSGEALGELQSAVQTWLGRNATAARASFVYQAWLDAGGAVEAVSVALLAWVGEHGQVPEAQFVYKAWLDAGGAVEAVSDALLSWVGEHGQMPAAEFVYQAWLDAGGAIAAISDDFLAWVGEHGGAFEADHVYRSWLEAGGDFELVREPVCRWALLWCGAEEFVYLSKALSKRADLPEPVIDAVARWCAAFPRHDDSLYRLSSLVNARQPGSLSAPAVISFMRSLETIFQERGDLTPLDRALLIQICANCARPHILNLDPFGVVRTVSHIIASGRLMVLDPELLKLPGSQYSGGLIAQFVLFGLRLGMLRTDRDSIALVRFREWLRLSGVDEGRAACLLDRLRTEFPSQIWV